MELRRQMKAIRGALPAEARARRSSAIVARVRELDIWSKARNVAAFVSIRGEADPGALVDEILASGKRLALPRVDMEAGVVRMHELREGMELVEHGRFRIPEPPADAPLMPSEELDLVLVPALGLDPRGHRIGWGRGFYDQLLPSMPNATRVAIAYDFQLLAEIPFSERDVQMDFVVTDRRTLEMSAGGE
ncbi:MAG: 5-formyltetrahydrofolate cyclo-ligase [Deltaproteobacteria bacterium]|nr:5-formyltetrahydrofolate cyclo-ligase [Deltaproteobacteria bacterium]